MPPRLARLLAIVVAAALVAGAFVLRGALAGDDDEPGALRPGGGEGGDRGDLVVACDEDLGEAACDAVAALDGVAAVEVVAAADVLEAGLADAPAPWDAWLTLDPMPGVLDAARREEGLAGITSDEVVPVASSPLVVLSFEASPVDCDAPVAWDCLVDQDVDPEVAVPAAETSLGFVAIAAAAAGVAGEEGFGIGDLRDTPEADAVEALVGNSPRAAGATAGRQARALLSPGTASAAVTVEGLGRRVAATPQGERRELQVLALEPAVTVGVVLAGLGPGAEDAVATLRAAVSEQTVPAALAEGGWTGDPDRTAGLPEADLVYALREELG